MDEDQLQSLVLISSKRDLADNIQLHCLVDAFAPKTKETSPVEHCMYIKRQPRRWETLGLCQQT